MSDLTNLAERSCAACEGWSPPLTDEEISYLKGSLDPDWSLDDEGKSLTREFKFKGFAKATYLANLVAFLSDREGHHADIAFGWGYCRVTYTSHSLGRLSENDFICAAKLDDAVR